MSSPLKIAVLLILLAVPAHAQTVGDWFNSLKLPAPIGSLPKGASCCSAADCRQRQIRSTKGYLEAFVVEIGQWRAIPLQTQITKASVLVNRPFYQAIVCYMPNHGIVCYVPGNTGG